MYMYIMILKTLRVTALSKGDGVIFDQGGNQGISRNHQDRQEMQDLHASEGPKARPGRFLGGFRDV